MTDTTTALFSPPGTAGYAEAGASILLAAPVEPAGAFTAPPEITTSLRVLSFPPLPFLPPYLAGRLALDGAATATAASDLPAAERMVDEMLAPLIALARPVANTWAVAGPEALPLTHMDPAQPVAFGSDSALINEIDPDGWAAVLGAGPGLLMVELRQLGGTFATPTGGALDHFAAPLLYHGVGAAGADTTKDLDSVRAAVAPYLTGFTAPNFIDHVDQPQRTHDDLTRVRVERVRLAADPTGLFAGDISPIRAERTAS